MDICFVCYVPISRIYRQRIEASAEHILAQGLTENKPPFVSYSGMNKDTQKALLDLRQAYDEQHRT